MLLATGSVGPSGSVATDPGVRPPFLLGVAIFSTLAVAGGAAALREAPLVTALCGGIALVPVGLYTLLLPWPYPLVGVLDLLLLASGVFLLRRE